MTGYCKDRLFPNNSGSSRVYIYGDPVTLLMSSLSRSRYYIGPETESSIVYSVWETTHGIMKAVYHLKMVEWQFLYMLDDSYGFGHT